MGVSEVDQRIEVLTTIPDLLCNCQGLFRKLDRRAQLAQGMVRDTQSGECQVLILSVASSPGKGQSHFEDLDGGPRVAEVVMGETQSEERAHLLLSVPGFTRRGES